jgi:prepilin-type N-terminal cleavage/methylation domain-containing protein
MMTLAYRSGKSNRRGFSLVELLTVIGIIAILAAMLFPVIGRAKAAVKKTQCTTNLAQLCHAVKMYKMDYHKAPPCLLPYAGPAVEAVDLKQYNIPMLERVKEPAAFHCPMALRYKYNFNPLILDRPRPGGAVDEVTVYTYSSYDGAPFYVDYGANARGLIREYNGDPKTSQHAYDNHRYWQGPVTMPPSPNTKRNLDNRNDEESAVVTWCPYHRDYKRLPGNGGLVLQRGSMDLVLYWNGSVKVVPTVQNLPPDDPVMWGFVEAKD